MFCQENKIIKIIKSNYIHDAQHSPVFQSDEHTFVVDKIISTQEENFPTYVPCGVKWRRFKTKNDDPVSSL